jgi:hypothetical protein
MPTIQVFPWNVTHEVRHIIFQIIYLFHSLLCREVYLRTSDIAICYIRIILVSSGRGILHFRELNIFRLIIIRTNIFIVLDLRFLQL